MASPDPVSTPEQVTPPLIFTSERKSSQEHLLAPFGWQKKIGSSKKGSTPSKRDVSFIAPDGEEVKSRKALDAYIKSHPGCPPASSFDWSTGETPTRRSTRLSSMTRPSLNSPEGGSAEKRRRKKVEDTLEHEEKGEPEEPVAEELPPKMDEIMKEVVKCEAKSVEDVPETPVGCDLDTENGVGEKEAIKEEQKSGDHAPPVIEGDLNESEVAETPAGRNLDTEDSVGAKEVIKEEQKAQDSSGCTPKEESTEAKDSSDKVTDVFQHCPEAPDASRQVDAST